MKTKLTLIFPVLVLCVSVFMSCKPVAQHNGQWRGPNRDGIYQEVELMDSWLEEGPTKLWQVDSLGRGYAAPVVVDGTIYVNTEKNGKSFLTALDTQGNKLWSIPNGKEFVGEGYSATYPGARSTPTVVGDLAYAISGMGRLLCADTRTGNELWSVDLVNDMGALIPMFGFSESPVVDEEKLFCFPGGAEHNLVALDRFTGEIIWTSKAVKDTFSYCSPILEAIDGKKVLIGHSRHAMYAADCETGDILGVYKLIGFEWDGEHCNSPLYHDGAIYFVGNDAKGEGALKIRLTDSRPGMEKVWNNKGIRNNFNGYILKDELLFTPVKGNWLKALDIQTGLVKDSVKAATGSLIYADNKFYCYGMNGEVNLITYKNQAFQNHGSFKVKEGTGHHFSHPVIQKGVLYIRHGDALMAWKI